jgi:tetraacyldisaccharide 4'-kinase
LPRSSRSIEQLWRRRGLLAWLLLPLSLIFLAAVWLRRLAYRTGLLRSVRLPVPVVVVGGIAVGGSGKTPLIIWLAQRLRELGKRPGIVSRGYGGDYQGVHRVDDDDSAAEVGDEPLLIRRRGNCPVFVGRRRPAAAQALLAECDCDVILCDDGLQHYALARDVEIAVIDRRGFWNGFLLPAGPLREPQSRLATVNAVVGNDWPGPADFRMRLEGSLFCRLDDRGATCAADELSGLRLHAMAGIGEPERFFDHLAAIGLHFEAHVFPDHHVYRAADLDFAGDAIVTTEKDAVKLAGLASMPVWVLPVSAVVEPDLAQFVLERIDGCAFA